MISKFSKISPKSKCPLVPFKAPCISYTLYIGYSPEVTVVLHDSLGFKTSACSSQDPDLPLHNFNQCNTYAYENNSTVACDEYENIN